MKDFLRILAFLLPAILLGGIFGYLFSKGDDNLYIERCYNAGDLRGGRNLGGIGGIVGVNGYFITEIKSCSNSGDIHATTVMYSVGGVVGMMGLDKLDGGL